MVRKAERPVLLWDGDCGFCQLSVEWINRQKGTEWFDTQTCQSHARYKTDLEEQCQREVVLLMPGGRRFGGHAAVARALRQTRFGWLARIFAIPPFSWLAWLGYRIVASNRMFFSKLLFKKAATCSLDDRPKPPQA